MRLLFAVTECIQEVEFAGESEMIPKSCKRKCEEVWRWQDGFLNHCIAKVWWGRLLDCQ